MEMEKTISNLLNLIVRTIDDISEKNHPEWVIPELKGTGKLFPYYGWYWRAVEFYGWKHTKTGDLTNVISLAKGEFGWGFCESNKWGYPEKWLNTEQTKLIRDQLIKLVQDLSLEGFKNFYELIQKCGKDKEGQYYIPEVIS